MKREERSLELSERIEGQLRISCGASLQTVMRVGPGLDMMNGPKPRLLVCVCVCVNLGNPAEQDLCFALAIGQQLIDCLGLCANDDPHEEFDTNGRLLL